jgi:hypothetical protein
MTIQMEESSDCNNVAIYYRFFDETDNGLAGIPERLLLSVLGPGLFDNHLLPNRCEDLLWWEFLHQHGTARLLGSWDQQRRVVS